MKNIDIAKKILRKYWYWKENDRKISISIFCKILILMKYCIDKILAYRTPLEIWTKSKCIHAFMCFYKQKNRPTVGKSPKQICSPLLQLWPEVWVICFQGCGTVGPKVLIYIVEVRKILKKILNQVSGRKHY